jgi:hypothetical protein
LRAAASLRLPSGQRRLQVELSIRRSPYQVSVLPRMSGPAWGRSVGGVPNGQGTPVILLAADFVERRPLGTAPCKRAAARGECSCGSSGVAPDVRAEAVTADRAGAELLDHVASCRCSSRLVQHLSAIGDGIAGVVHRVIHRELETFYPFG